MPPPEDPSVAKPPGAGGPAPQADAQPGGLRRVTAAIAALAAAAMVLHLALRFGFHAARALCDAPLLVALALGGGPLLYDLLRKALRREFGSDQLGGISIVTSLLLGEYLAGSIIVLMLSGGEALEGYALRSASSVLAALAERMPSIGHRKRGDALSDVALADIMSHTDNGRRLMALPELRADVAFCAQRDVFDLVAGQSGGGLIQLKPQTPAPAGGG